MASLSIEIAKDSESMSSTFRKVPLKKVSNEGKLRDFDLGVGFEVGVGAFQVLLDARMGNIDWMRLTQLARRSLQECRKYPSGSLLIGRWQR